MCTSGKCTLFSQSNPPTHCQKLFQTLNFFQQTFDFCRLNFWRHSHETLHGISCVINNICLKTNTSNVLDTSSDNCFDLNKKKTNKFLHFQIILTLKDSHKIVLLLDYLFTRFVSEIVWAPLRICFVLNSFAKFHVGWMTSLLISAIFGLDF